MDEARIFNEALQRPPRARGAWLADVCDGDDALRARVERLLDAHERGEGFMARGGVADDERTIGAYRILDEIGQGGCGTVYVAEQTEPVRRRVALKVIKAGMDSREVVKRFEAERQALALMDHPNIARVFDGGTTPRGRPYFVMELVKGISILSYCDQCRVSLRERLRLFVEVCRAVQHAHQKGVIHRDLKPSNILVGVMDGRAATKVIDFGVAKAIGQQLTDATFHTAFAQMIGTPQYMSPEQAEMSALDVDTRADVYGLGVVLYELLTGTPPLTRERLLTLPIDELRRVIREEDPPTPSARLTQLNGSGETVAAARRTDLRRLVRAVHGDLDWIVMKALEKDRTRRYDTPLGMADDVERYLANEPILARRPSWAYRGRKFLRRNRTGVAVVAAAVVALALGAWILQDRGARADRLTSDASSALAEATRLQEDAWAGSSRPTRVRGRLEAAAAALDRARALLDAVPGGADAAVATRLKDAYAALRANEADLALLSGIEALRLRDPAIGTPSSATAEREERVRATTRDVEGAQAAFFAQHFGEPGEGNTTDMAARIRARSAPARDAVVAWLYAWHLQAHRAKAPYAGWISGVLEAADEDPLRREVRAAIVRGDRGRIDALARSETPREPLSSMVLANTLLAAGALDAATRVLHRDLLRHPDDYELNSMLAALYVRQRRPREALPYFQAVFALRPDSALHVVALNYVYNHTGAYAEALAAADRAIELDPSLAEAYDNRGVTLFHMERYDAAVKEHERAIARDPGLGAAYHNLSRAQHALGKLADAEATLRRGIKAQPGLAELHAKLSEILLEQGRVPAALEAQRRALQLDPGQAVWFNQLGALLSMVGRPDDAMEAFEQAQALDPSLLEANVNLAQGYAARRQFDKALASCRAALALDEKSEEAHLALGTTHFLMEDYPKALQAFEAVEKLNPENGLALCNLGAVHLRLADPAKAIEACERGLRHLPEGPRQANGYQTMGLAFARQGNGLKAEAAFRASIRSLEPNLPAHTQLAYVLAATNRVSEAVEHLEQALKVDPKHFEVANALAWMLVTHPDLAKRDAPRAVALATRALEGSPDNGAVMNTLGIALMQDGKSKRAIEVLMEAIDRQQGGSAYDYFPLAAAHAALGAVDEARRWQQRGLEWMAKNSAQVRPELVRLRDEAAARVEPEKK